MLIVSNRKVAAAGLDLFRRFDQFNRGGLGMNAALLDVHHVGGQLFGQLAEFDHAFVAARNAGADGFRILGRALVPGGRELLQIGPSLGNARLVQKAASAGKRQQ